MAHCKICILSFLEAPKIKVKSVKIEFRLKQDNKRKIISISLIMCERIFLKVDFFIKKYQVKKFSPLHYSSSLFSQNFKICKIS